METPILFLIFNRPDKTEKVFEEIKNAKPKKLFVAADGPRQDKEGELEKCEETRKIIEKVNWECEVKTLFRDKNLGCKKAVSSAISWFFENVETGIILEDDIIPDPSFFPYCEILLDLYRNDERVMVISGHNSQFGNRRGGASYYFTKYCHIWGWATWRRAWKKYDIEMKTFPEFVKHNRIKDVFELEYEQKFWMKNFQMVYEKNLDTWDYQWVYAILSNNALAISPNVNLTSNVGFDESGTHTKDSKARAANMSTSSLDLNNLIHPKIVLPNREAEIFTLNKVWGIYPESSSKSQNQISTKFTFGKYKAKNFIKRLLK